LEVALAPDARVVLPELAEGLPPRLALDGCGDSWSHVLEGALSPLAEETVSAQAAPLMREMLDVGLGNDPRWFDLSARACALQARASVGLIHAIAHVLEGPLQNADSKRGWGHARLCAIYAWPVLHLNAQINDKWPRFAATHDVNRDAVEVTVQRLYDDADFSRTLVTLEERWGDVLRDPLCRSNSALIRRSDLEHFTERRFL
jgi:alcohol dehydrogenase class IV